MTVGSVLELVARMRREAFRRGRHEDASADHRVWRYLGSLEKELVNAARLHASLHLEIEPRAEGGRRIVIEVAELGLRRVAVVTAEEYQLLREHPDARAVLDRVDRSTAPATR